tara:strand:+ start:1667 stop:1870 length:204 start_codon:yes stop_codon:yes gene_type:complete
MTQILWTIKEERHDGTWWLIRGNAFTNKITDKYPNKVFEYADEAISLRDRLNVKRGVNVEVVEYLGD